MFYLQDSWFLTVYFFALAQLGWQCCLADMDDVSQQVSSASWDACIPAGMSRRYSSLHSFAMCLWISERSETREILLQQNFRQMTKTWNSWGSPFVDTPAVSHCLLLCSASDTLACGMPVYWSGIGISSCTGRLLPNGARGVHPSSRAAPSGASAWCSGKILLIIPIMLINRRLSQLFWLF